MATETKTDQSATKSEPKSLSEYMDKGWEAFDATAKKETKPDDKKAVSATPAVEDDCPDCPPEEKKRRAEEKAKLAKPYKILKVDGKDVPVATEEDYLALAQKGYDYTRKTQQVSEDRKAMDKEFGEKADQMNELAEKFNVMWEKVNQEGRIQQVQAKQEDTIPVDKSTLYKRFGIDEEDAEPYQVKFIEHIANLEEKQQNLEKKNEALEGTTKLVLLKEAMNNLGNIIKEARKQYPFEEILNEKGENLTSLQFVNMLVAKDKDPKNKNRQLPDLAIETVKELSYIQQQSKKGIDEINPENMSVDQFKERFPDLYSKIAGTEGDKAVAEHLKEDEETPPSLKSIKTDVDTKSKKGKEPKSLKEFMDEGFANLKKQQSIGG